MTLCCRACQVDCSEVAAVAGRPCLATVGAARSSTSGRCLRWQHLEHVLGSRFRPLVEVRGFKTLVVDDSKLARIAVPKVLDGLVLTGPASRPPTPTALAPWRAEARPGRRRLRGAGERRAGDRDGGSPDRPTMPFGDFRNHRQEIIDRADAVGATFFPTAYRPASGFLLEAVRRMPSSARHERRIAVHAERIWFDTLTGSSTSASQGGARPAGNDRRAGAAVRAEGGPDPARAGDGDPGCR